MLTYRLKTILGNIAIAVVLMAILAVMAEFKAPFTVVMLFSILVGFFLALFRMSKLYKSVRRLPFLLGVFVQLIIFQLFIIAAASVIDLITAYSDLHILERTGRYEMLHERNTKLYYKSQIYAFILIFFFELQSILGRGFLWHYVVGTYYKPRREERVLMSLDLANSTSLAEKLGEKGFYSLLNDCYSLLTKPCIQTRAKIFKYIGDEAILTWSVDAGLSQNNCVEVYRLYSEAIDGQRAYFQEKYGVVPHFRAAVHMGMVVAAYLGDERKQLDYSGDTMNTTARILGACSRYDADLLVSQAVFDRLELPVQMAEAISGVELKGKAEAMVVYRVG